MFWTIAAILFVLWVLGMISGSTVGLWVHLLLVFALVNVILGVATVARFTAKQGGDERLAPPRRVRRRPAGFPGAGP